MSKKDRVRVKTRTKCQAMLNLEIRKFNRELRKRDSDRKKENKIVIVPELSPYAKREMESWAEQFKEIMLNKE